MIEVWKDIKGYEGLYQISNLGKVKSFHHRKEIIRKTCLSKGYRMVNLHKDGIYRPITIHKLVATYFISNPDSKPQINHIDGLKENNIYTNLEWCTGSENIKHAYKIGLEKGRPKINREQAKIIKGLKGTKSLSNIGKMFNVSKTTIWKIFNNKRWIEL